MTIPVQNQYLGSDKTSAIQAQLTGNGFDTQGIDGKWGPHTQAALEAFQNAQGLTPGIYDSATDAQLFTENVIHLDPVVVGPDDPVTPPDGPGAPMSMTTKIVIGAGAFLLAFLGYKMVHKK